MLSRLWSFLLAVRSNRKQLTQLPRFLTYTVTYGCNARCSMCDSWKLPTAGDLSLDDVDNIFRQLPRMDAVRLTGGEPFIRTDLTDIARLAVRHLQPLVLHVTTNGFLTERILKFCEDRPRRTPLDLLVSIDGDADKHNAVRGHSQAFSMAFETVRLLAPLQKKWNLRLAVNQTIIDADGLEQYRRLRDLLSPLGIRNQVVIAYDASATYSQDRGVNLAPEHVGEFTTFGNFTRDEMQTLLDEIDADVARYPWGLRLAKRYYMRGIRNRLLHHAGAPNPPCVALNSHMRLFPNGDVPTCQFNSHIIGNLRKQKFADVWFHPQSEQQRDWVRQCPGCWAECEVLTSAIYTLDLLTSAAGRTSSAATAASPGRAEPVPQMHTRRTEPLIDLQMPGR